MLRITQHRFTIEIDATEHTAKLSVTVLNTLEGGVNHLTNLGIKAVLIQIIESLLFAKHERKILFRTLYAHFISFVAFLQLTQMLFIGIVQIFQEEHRKDKVLVICSIDRAAEGSCCLPKGCLYILRSSFTHFIFLHH